MIFSIESLIDSLYCVLSSTLWEEKQLRITMEVYIDRFLRKQDLLKYFDS